MSHTSSPTGKSHIRMLLIRHAESTANEAGILSTTQPGPELTPRGREQAEALAETLRDAPLDGLYASTLRRTQLTAEPLSRATGLPLTVIEGIHEIEAGELEDRSDHEAMSAYASPFRIWAQGDFTAAVPGGFSGDHFFERFDRGIAEIWRAQQASSPRPTGWRHGRDRRPRRRDPRVGGRPGRQPGAGVHGHARTGQHRHRGAHGDRPTTAGTSSRGRASRSSRATQ